MKNLKSLNFLYIIEVVRGLVDTVRGPGESQCVSLCWRLMKVSGNENPTDKEETLWAEWEFTLDYASKNGKKGALSLSC